MKKSVFLLLFAALTTFAVADIQAPPGSRQEPLRKLSRGFANILYGVTEIPNTWNRQMKYNSSQAFAEATIRGTGRSIARVCFGAYEVVTFPLATYKSSYRAPYKLLTYDPNHGFSEYPPEVGFMSASEYGRKTPY